MSVALCPGDLVGIVAMAATVASPLERQFSGIAGVDSMTSSSTLGSSTIALQFDIDGAAVDAQTAMAAAAAAAAAGTAGPADVPQSQPGRPGDLRDRPQFGHAVSV